MNHLKSLVSTVYLKPMDSPKSATLIINPLKADGKTLRICADYCLTLNSKLRQYQYTAEKPDDIPPEFNVICWFPKPDIREE